MKKVTPILVSLILFFCCMSFWTDFTRAADFVASNDKEEINISREQTARNLFVAGGIVNIEAKEILKDLFVAGKTISVDTTVENNVFAAGETVTIKGKIGGNLFALSKTLIINAEIEGDVFALGADIHLEDGAQVFGDIYSGSDKLYLRGQVMGDVLAGCSEATVEGSILGTLELKVEKSLKIVSGAIIQNLDYSSPNEASIDEGAEVRKKTYTPMVSSEKSKRGRPRFGGLFAGLTIFNWFSSLILAFIFLALLKKPCQSVLNKAQEQFGLGMAFGLSFIIGAPIAVLILFFTFFGFKVALALTFFTVFVWTIASTLASLLMGVFIQYLISKDRKNLGSYLNWVSVLLGVSAYHLLLLVPVLGWLLRVISILLVVGGLLMYLGEQISSKNTPSSPIVEVTPE